MFKKNFDVIVVGGGHAGVEAAAAAARMGAQTLLITQNLETIGQMSCNPAIGGIGKGHLVKEVDAMGGLMASAADEAGIQFRILNSSKGPAVRATRAQACRYLYKLAIRKMVEQQNNLQIFQQSVGDLIIENNKVTGVITELGLKFYSKVVIFTVGTFLGGKIHIGDLQSSGGRQGDAPSNALANRLRALDFSVGRLKTGTPPRIDGNTVDYSNLEMQPGDSPLPVFSFMGNVEQHPRQVPCYITYTNEKTHQIITDNIKHSAMYSGNIEGVGPRYCPSIEDKVMRFAHRNKHQVFIEPESLYSNEIYPNGLSTSLPFAVQVEFIQSIKGFENAHITRAGYAIEYDYFDPRGLHPWLETKNLENLFFAGQINGTTGYEEAASQGIIAGLNAANKAKGENMWWPKRNEAYMGVLIDDLITLGTSEPYRMFTSRAEYRLILREDNADQRLTPYAHKFGLIDRQRAEHYFNKQKEIENLLAKLNTTYIQPKTAQADIITNTINETISKDVSLAQIIRRPSVEIKDLQDLYAELFAEFSNESISQVEITIKYEGYIKRQQQEVDKKNKHENTIIPYNFNYKCISGLSNEVQEKLIKHKPTTIGMASRISGITPAAISLLLIQLKKQKG